MAETLRFVVPHLIVSERIPQRVPGLLLDEAAAVHFACVKVHRRFFIGFHDKNHSIGEGDAGLPFHIGNWVDQAVTFTRGHRPPKLYGRSLSDWLKLLQANGFEVETADMCHGKPFANVMLLAGVPG